MKKTLILCVGLPRSGKSTWVSKKIKDFVVVNPDAIRLAIYNQPFILETEPFVWMLSKYMVESLFLAGHDKIILDSTSVTKKARDFWKSDKWVRRYKFFKTSKEVCFERAKKDGRDYLIPVIEKMASSFEPVEDEEWDGFYSSKG